MMLRDEGRFHGGGVGDVDDDDDERYHGGGGGDVDEHYHGCLGGDVDDKEDERYHGGGDVGDHYHGGGPQRRAPPLSAAIQQPSPVFFFNWNSNQIFNGHCIVVFNSLDYNWSPSYLS